LIISCGKSFVRHTAFSIASVKIKKNSLTTRGLSLIPEFNQGLGGVTKSPTLRGPVLVWS